MEKSKDVLRKLVLNKEKWEDYPEDLEETSIIILKVNEDIRLHIGCGENYSEFSKDLLKKNYIEFSVRYEKYENGESENKDFFNKVEGLEYYTENWGWVIWKYFTLGSESEESQIELFQEFYTWLDILPRKYLPVDEMLEKFEDSLNAQYRDKITQSKNFLRKLVLDRKKWRDHPEDKTSSIILKVNEDIRLHIGLTHDEKYSEFTQDILKKHYIEFSVRYEKDPDSHGHDFFSDVDVKGLKKDGTQNDHWLIWKYFTLGSKSEESQIKLFREFWTWLKKLPENKKLPVKEMLEKFEDSLNPGYRDKITKDL